MLEAWKWFAQHSSSFSVLVNLGMLTVWAVYLQLILESHRRARRCKILISIGGTEDLGARCLISNMSAEPVYVVRVMARVSAGGEEWSSAVTEYGALGEETPLDPERMTRQGPLLTGQWRDIGSVSDLVGRVIDLHGQDQSVHQVFGRDDSPEICFTVIALYGSDDLPVGGSRRFTVTNGGDGDWKVEPLGADTEQFRGGRRRRELRELL